MYKVNAGEISVNKQLENNKVLDTELLGTLKSKTFYSGREMKVGDQILFGLLPTYIPNTNPQEIDYKLVTFHKDEINTIYEITENGNGTIPVLKQLNNEIQ